MGTTILAARAEAEDRLIVEGLIDGIEEDDAPKVLVAEGWLSAMTNHYDVDESGERKKGAKPREMSDAEKLAYMQSLLEARYAPVSTELKVVGMAPEKRPAPPIEESATGSEG